MLKNIKISVSVQYCKKWHYSLLLYGRVWPTTVVTWSADWHRAFFRQINCFVLECLQDLCVVQHTAIVVLWERHGDSEPKEAPTVAKAEIECPKMDKGHDNVNGGSRGVQETIVSD